MKNIFSRAVLSIALTGLYPLMAINPATAQVAVNAGTHDASTSAMTLGTAAMPQATGSSVWNAGAYAANRQIGEMRLQLSTATLPADGQSALTVEISVTDRRGNLVQGEVFLTLETSAGRILLPGARTDELGPGRLDADRATAGTQLKVVDGKASFQVIAPSMPQEGMVRVTGGTAFAERKLSFIPEAREMIAVGLVEGIVSLRRIKNESAVTAVRNNDGFDEALRSFEREFSVTANKAGSAAARAAFFVKGTITGQTILSAAYDSDKETRARMLRDITADQVYPVFGDASIKGFEAKSSQKFYVRLDNGKNYVLYGDFSTSDGFSQSSGTGSVASVRQRDLGSNGRSLTGVRGHIELSDNGSFVNVYGAKDTLNNLVEEVKGNGGSFYNLSRSDALENSEKLEIITRDRNNTGRVLSVQPLQRFADYSFEPFNGRILLAAPLSSADAQGNPRSLRMGYEVDHGGKKYLVAGIDGQIKLGTVGEVGASYIKDNNPTLPTGAGERKLSQLASVNVGVNLGSNAKAVVEVAQSHNATLASTTAGTGDVKGKAVRAEIAVGQASNTVSGSVFYGKADRGFYNANASLNEGREEAGIKAALRVTERLTVRGELIQSKDHNPAVTDIAHPDGAVRRGANLNAEYAFNDAISVSLGVRKAQDNGASTSASGVANTTSLFGSGGIFGTSGVGSGVQTSNTNVTALGNQGLDSTTVQLGIRGKVSNNLTLGVEGETGKNDGASIGSSNRVNRLAATAQWQVAERTAINARYETQTGVGSTYDRESRNNAFVLGVTNTYLNSGLGQGNGGAQGELFSEYRLRDAIGGRESQLASGLRNTFDIAEGLRGVAGAEYVKVLNGSVQPMLALAGGLDYTASELWKGSTRLEWRKVQQGTATTTNPASPGNTGIMNTVSIARKLDRDWTGLARNYLATTDSTGQVGKQMQERFTVGFAYRPVDADRFDALGKLEYRLEKNGEATTMVNNVSVSSPEARKALVASVSANWHPTRNWWLSGRIAAKRSHETAYTNKGNGTGLSAGTSSFSAAMVSARAIYDITSRWDIGALASVMQGGGARQYAYGLETGFVLRRNLWLSAGYNVAGFTDRDLTGNEYTAKGPYLRLRAKFNENLFSGYDDTIVTK
jgi:hypothetical protein